MATFGLGGSVGGSEPPEDDDVPPLEEVEDLRARDCLVQTEDHIEANYRVGALELTPGGGDLCAVVAIGVLQGKVLVAVPEEVWSRQLSKRKLPVKALSKASLVAVAACKKDARGEEEDILQQIKVWVGLLDPTLEDSLTFIEDEGMTYHFGSIEGDFALPFGPALVQVADEHFLFVSAESGVPRGGGKQPRGLEARLSQLEATLQTVTQALENVVPEKQPLEGKPKHAPRPSALKKPPKAAAGSVKGLDQSTVAAALEAGVPLSHLTEMGKILQRRPANLEDQPRRPSQPRRGPLDESEGENEDGEAELIPAENGEVEGGDSTKIQEAILKLTAITERLVSGGEGKKDKLEIILDGAGSGSALSSESGGAPGARKNAAALRALQRMLREDPKYIYQNVESNLQADFAGRAPVAGEPLAGGTTVRGWLVSRSRVQNYQQHVRWCWGLAGIWDELISQRPEEARARCALLMAAADQASIDGGNWVLSHVGLLEPVPPYQLFTNHSPPTPAEAQHSALYDVRWAEIFLAQLKEMDSFVDAKRKLGGKRSGGRGENEEDPVRIRPNPKPKGKGKTQKPGAAQEEGGQ